MVQTPKPVNYATTIRDLTKRLEALERHNRALAAGLAREDTGAMTVHLSANDGNVVNFGSDGGLYVPAPDAAASTVPRIGIVATASPLTVTLDGRDLPAQRISEHTFTDGEAVWVLPAGNLVLVIGAVESEPDPPPPPYVPPTPLLWYRADDATGADGDDVTALPSALAGGPGLVSTTAEPLLRLASLGAHQGIEFAASHPGGYMSGKGARLYVPVSPGHTFTTHGGCTIFVVGSANTGAGGMLGLAGPNASIAARTGYFLTMPPPNDGSSLWRTYTSVTDSVARIFEWRYSQDDLAYRRGGADQTLVSNDDSPDPLTGRAADATYTSTGGTFGIAIGDNLNGILYEVRIYDGVLAGDDLAWVRADLAAIYGLPA